MIKILSFTATTLLFVSHTFSQVNFQNLSFDEAVEQAKKENKLVFVDVYAEWCGPCKMLDRNVFPDEDLGKKFNNSFISIKVDGDEDASWGVKESFGISAYPTMLMINPQTGKNRKIEGYVQAEELLSEAGYALQPETSPANVAKANYEANPTRENFRDWVEKISDDNGSTVEEVYETMDLFIEQYPVLDFDDEIELVIFLSTTKSLNDPNMARFIEEIDEQDDEVSYYAFMQLIRSSFNQAKAENDISIVENLIKEAFPIFEPYLGEDITQAHLLEIVKEAFEEE
jgi:thiol-disulfide isomerase/thioredoxin